jgi:hypothetical protein
MPDETRQGFFSRPCLSGRGRPSGWGWCLKVSSSGGYKASWTRFPVCLVQYRHWFWLHALGHFGVDRTRLVEWGLNHGIFDSLTEGGTLRWRRPWGRSCYLEELRRQAGGTEP